MKRACKPRMASHVQAKHSSDGATCQRQQPQQVKLPPANAFRHFGGGFCIPLGYRWGSALLFLLAQERAFARHQLAALCHGTCPVHACASGTAGGAPGKAVGAWLAVGAAVAGDHAASHSAVRSGSARIWRRAEAAGNLGAQEVLLQPRWAAGPAEGLRTPTPGCRGHLREPRFGSSW